MGRQRPSSNYDDIRYRPRDLPGTPYEVLRAATGVALTPKPTHRNGTPVVCDECGGHRGYAENNVQTTCTWTDHDGSIGPISDFLGAAWCEVRAYTCARWEIHGYEFLSFMAHDSCPRVRASLALGLHTFIYGGLIEHMAGDESIMVRRAMWSRRDRLPNWLVADLAEEFSSSPASGGRR